MAKASSKTSTVKSYAKAAGVRNAKGRRATSSGTAISQDSYERSVSKVLERNRKALKELAKY